MDRKSSELANDLQTENQLYINSNYSDQFFAELRSLFVKSKFTDVVLICAKNPSLDPNQNSDNDSTAASYVNVSIPCHKLVLSAFSPYFQAMFSSNLIETRTNQVFLPNVDFKTLNDVINYAYCGSIYLNVNNVQAIFQLSSLFQTRDLYNACCMYMESKLDTSNCMDVYQFAKQHMCDYLTLKSKDFICHHFNELLKNSREFVDIDDVDLIEEVLSCDDLEVTSEEVVLEALLKWVKHDSTNRRTHFDKLFKSVVRLGLIDMTYLTELALKNENDDDLIKTRIKELAENANLSEKKEKPRAGMAKAQQCFVLLGGSPDSCDGSYVNCFNPFNGEKYFFSTSFLDKSYYEGKGYFHVENPGVCVTHDNKLFVAGGLYVFHKLKYPLKTSLKDSKAASSGNIIDESQSFMNDGEDLKDGEEMLSKEMYEYDTKNDTWLKRANMLFAKANLSLCAMRDRIYSFGGVSSGQIPLDIVEYYDMTENKWVYVGSMPAPFVAGSVVAYEDRFFVLGGRNGVGRHDCCYIFRPHINQWTEIGKLNVGRFNFGACIIDDHLYAFGGQRYSESEEHYFTREALDSVEIYDVKNGGEWRLGPKMPASLYNTGCFIMGDEQQEQQQSSEPMLSQLTNTKLASVYLCGTTECQYSGTTLFGFMFTSVFRLDFCNESLNTSSSSRPKLKWKIIEHDVSEVKAYYRCVGARVNTRKLIKFSSDIRQTNSSSGE